MKQNIVLRFLFALLFVFVGIIQAQVPAVIDSISGVWEEDKSWGYRPSAVTAADVNGDGYKDIILGVYTTNKIRIFYGGEFGFGDQPDVTIPGPEGINLFGVRVVSGDVNGDGFADVVTGCPFSLEYADSTNSGVVFVYLGGSPMDTEIDRELRSSFPRKSGFFGFGVQVLNWDGDGYGDIVVSASREDVYGAIPIQPPGMESAAEIPTYNSIMYLFKGKANLAEITMDAACPGLGGSGKVGEGAGMSFGDVNGDGLDDLLADNYGSTYSYSDQTEYVGKMGVYLGSDNLETIGFWPQIILKKQDPVEAELFSWNMSNAGDINGDGLDDIIVGGFTDKIYVFYGPVRKLDADVILHRPEGSLETAWAKYGANELGDINGDGFDDFVIPSPLDKADDGVAFITLGSANGPQSGFVTVENPIAGSAGHFGHGSCALGDINGDGFDDFCIIAPDFRDSLNVVDGRVYIYAGSADITTSLNDNVLNKLPVHYSLSQNYPNPFNPETMINFSLTKTGHVTLTVYNSVGQKIKTLVNEVKDAGYHQIQWDGKNTSGQKVSSGVYYYKIQMGDIVRTRNMILMK